MDAITLLLYLFFGLILVVIVLAGIAFLKALFGIHPVSGTTNSSKVAEETYHEEEDQLEKDLREDSGGDGLMLFDDPMFPPEFDNGDDL